MRILSDGRFEYDPTGSTPLQDLLDGESLTDTFTYTLIDNQGGTDTATVSMTVFGLGAAGTPPSAQLNAGAVTTGAADHTFTVRYTDDSGVDVTSIDGNDIRVTGPGGFDVAATWVTVDDATNGTPRIATYSIAAPGGSWDGADNGTYTISMQAGPGRRHRWQRRRRCSARARSRWRLTPFQRSTVSGTTFATLGENVVLTLDAISSFPPDPSRHFHLRHRLGERWYV